MSFTSMMLSFCPILLIQFSKEGNQYDYTETGLRDQGRNVASLSSQMRFRNLPTGQFPLSNLNQKFHTKPIQSHWASSCQGPYTSHGGSHWWVPPHFSKAAPPLPTLNWAGSEAVGQLRQPEAWPQSPSAAQKSVGKWLHPGFRLSKQFFPAA